ncbi:MAG: NfeD family protein [bacterium]
MCHLVLMMPVLGLAVFWFLRFSLALPAYVVILILSALVYLVIMQAMKKSVQTGPEGLLHEMVEVLEPLRLEGHVRVHGEIWKAESSEPLRKGDRAEIVGVEGLTLKVRSYKEEHLPGFRKPGRCERQLNQQGRCYYGIRSSLWDDRG